jgi:hypothetical protein
MSRSLQTKFTADAHLIAEQFLHENWTLNAEKPLRFQAEIRRPAVPKGKIKSRKTLIISGRR